MRASLFLCASLFASVDRPTLAAGSPRAVTQPDVEEAEDYPRSAPDQPVTGGGVGARGLNIIENRGQWDCAEGYVGKLNGLLVRADERGFGVQIFDVAGDSSAGVYVRFVFDGASPGATLIPERPTEALHSWFLGNDPTRWVRGLRSHTALRWHGVYQGVDFVLREDQGALKFDLELAADADLGQVRLRCEGTEQVEIDLRGALVIATEKGCFTQEAPVSLQIHIGGRQTPVVARYRVLDERTFGFAVEGRDPAAALWIDPPLQWSTYFGGGSAPQVGWDTAQAVCLDRAEDVYTCGSAAGTSFPVTPGAYRFQSGVGNDCFAAKFRGGDGALMFSSVFGGSHVQEVAMAIRVDGQGQVVVAGTTDSVNFPSTPGSFDPSFGSLQNALFCLKLTPLGDQLVWSTFLQRADLQGGVNFGDMVLSPTGAPILVGGAGSGFPTTPGALDTTPDLYNDAFVTVLDPTGSYLEWSTFLGGSSVEDAVNVDVDASGFITVAGTTQSVDFPTTPNAYMPTYPGDTGNRNLFITRMRPDGSGLVWSTYLGGLNGGGGTDYLHGLALAPDGSVVIAGDTQALAWPLTPGAVGTQPVGGYVTRIDPSGSSLMYSTYLGTPNIPIGIAPARALTVDSSGIATVVAHAAGMSTTHGAFDSTYSGAFDAFLARVNPTGTKLYYATYLGGNADDDPRGVVTSQNGRLTVVGQTFSTNFPTTPGAHSPNSNGGSECFITTFEPYLRGVEPLGRGTRSCHMPLVANATEMPEAGAAGFGLYLSGAPANSRGVLLIATAPSVGALSIHNARLWLDPSSIVTRVPIRTDSLGFTETALPLSGVAVGAQFYAQYFVRNAPDCTNGFLTASPALRLTVQ